MSSDRLSSPQSSAVTQIVVEVYKEADYLTRTGQVAMTFINPASYCQSWDFRIGVTEKASGGNTRERLTNIRGATFTLTFLVDGTGVVQALSGGAENSAGPDVKKKVWQFLETATILNSDNTRKAAPPYCLLIWNDVCVKCLVESVQLETKLLNRKGEWLRASLTVTFRHLLPTKP